MCDDLDNRFRKVAVFQNLFLSCTTLSYNSQLGTTENGARFSLIRIYNYNISEVFYTVIFKFVLFLC